jgi:hypothetical protein
VAVAEPGRVRIGLEATGKPPDDVVNDSDPAIAAGKGPGGNRGGDVHLMLFGAGLRLTESLSPDTGLTFKRTRALPGGSVEILYAVND